jgi:hypothetical protein
VKEPRASWLKAFGLVALILVALWILWALFLIFFPIGID